MASPSACKDRKLGFLIEERDKERKGEREAEEKEEKDGRVRSSLVTKK
ncbi:uncharacterized protein ARB_07754 [Trichophyton benhamiae CBS 112371]|uniref:Uncharacterized protein n=1 Tax=Arthroderma benhamiae (strain ATCC MYA-4681 / CBS 112371) TaxID=663331 RepID=D4AUC4_ARTBC|nr:uncharacterized protein ARB_07754 [Trichophyton benhamiae CBS 112371]EFE33394.1 hypothetical protein ARB_07754 [Trichophyton benhamiae CBS 112371]